MADHLIAFVPGCTSAWAAIDEQTYEFTLKAEGSTICTKIRALHPGRPRTHPGPPRTLRRGSKDFFRIERRIRQLIEATDFNLSPGA